MSSEYNSENYIYSIVLYYWYIISVTILIIILVKLIPIVVYFEIITKAKFD